MICAVYGENEKNFQALTAGASDYILKKTAPVQILEAIRELYEEEASLSSQIARKVVAAFQNKPTQTVDAEGLDILSHREKEILEQLSKGLMYKEIAAELFMSLETVRKNVYHIHEKLQVTNRIEAVNTFLGR